ncbi:hypothetical protein LOZ64_000550 [Ophidiomyces ophidiicola]|nr:hypothetical protein LOZ64_000550 [Ophidiomyces ophidiicola]KAI2013584.1 hypothetical protein LOZ49_001920 [Ophidiomyces ophidiicola]KAI2026498.1 hypothetical protein LOZ46_000491 [Ophidiomyces ophidiicola]KAI2139324.1 hypothetical protein LOZ29_002492 [Ophidiomyces ophidiicola]KAI2147517.1 hypothetical protein LOZ28_000031 [Ophidiomyces ophidiicola]
MAHLTGAQVIARSLRDLGVTVVFGIVGIPVVEIAEEAINLGIRFIAFRNEQACSYAASAYGFMTGRPGVCLVVGGPGVLHAMAGIGNASANGFPLLILAGSVETTAMTKGGFQEMDAIALLTPHTKAAIRPVSVDAARDAIRNAYRICWYGRPGATFIDLPADLIQGRSDIENVTPGSQEISSPPLPAADPARIFKVVQILKSAKSPLIIVGKGAAYARAEASIRELIERTGVPFLPTPMGKGVVPDSHALNASGARSVALKNADVVILFGARLNWILHFGEPPRWSSSVKIIQVDIRPEELGHNMGIGELGLVGDIDLVAKQLLSALSGWRVTLAESYLSLLAASTAKNRSKMLDKALKQTPVDGLLTFHRTFHIIKTTLNTISPPELGGIVYVSEGANTMDISRSVFELEYPRQRLDAGTYATMGVGLGYIAAAHAAFNLSSASKGSTNSPPKKIVAFEGDSAFGFSAMEVETLARHQIPALIFVVNNSGVYHGDAINEADWRELQKDTIADKTKIDANQDTPNSALKKGLRSTSLLYNTRYEYLSTMCGGNGFLVRTEKELESATKSGFLEKEKVTIINVIIEPGIGQSIQFGWQASKGKDTQEAKL